MAFTTTEQAPSSLLYLERNENFRHEKLCFACFPIGDIPEVKQTNMHLIYQGFQIHNIGGREREFNLDEAGFKLALFTTRLSAEDFNNFSKTQEGYFKEIEIFPKQLLGVTWVLVLIAWYALFILYAFSSQSCAIP